MKYYKWHMWERARQIEKEQKIGFHDWSDCYIYAKYLKTKNYSEYEVEQELESVFLNSYPDGRDNFWIEDRKELIVSDIMGCFENLRLLPTFPIYFYKEELDVITALDNFTEQRVLFCLLYIHKYTGYDYFQATNADICTLCGKRINYDSINKAMYHLNQRNYISFYKYHEWDEFKSETRIIHPALNKLYDSKPVIEIESERNIFNYYLQYIGKGNFIPCKNCRRLIERTSNAIKYCPDCKRIMELERHKKYNLKRKSVRTTIQTSPND